MHIRVASDVFIICDPLCAREPEQIDGWRACGRTQAVHPPPGSTTRPGSPTGSSGPACSFGRLTRTGAVLP